MLSSKWLCGEFVVYNLMIEDIVCVECWSWLFLCLLVLWSVMFSVHSCVPADLLCSFSYVIYYVVCRCTVQSAWLVVVLQVFFTVSLSFQSNLFGQFLVISVTNFEVFPFEMWTFWGKIRFPWFSVWKATFRFERLFPWIPSVFRDRGKSLSLLVKNFVTPKWPFLAKNGHKSDFSSKSMKDTRF